MTSRPRRAAIALLAAVSVVAACNESFRFDVGRADAARGSDAASTPRDGAVAVVDASVDRRPADVAASSENATPSCTPSRCPFSGAPCTGAACMFRCERADTCTGTCGDRCAVECEGSSHCTATAGADANLRCESGASCSFRGGEGSTALCLFGSVCHVRCSGACSVTCDDGTCDLACGAGAPVRVDDVGSCP